jgi:hypothetical protein
VTNFFLGCSRWDWENVFNIIDFGNDSIVKWYRTCSCFVEYCSYVVGRWSNAHSALKLSLNIQINETPTCNFSRNSSMVKVLHQSKLIAWDECTMAHKIFGNIRTHVARFSKEPKLVWWCNDFMSR